MVNFVKLNGGTAIPLDTIKFMRPLTQEDHDRIKEKHGTDVSDRHIQVTFADNSQRTFRETLDEVREQGIGLVNTGNDRHVIAENILSADPFTKADAEVATAKGYTLTATFRSRVNMRGNTQVLSSAHPSQIMERRAKALERAGQGAPAPKPAGA